MNERVQKVLGRAGLASRRAIERWVAAGRVTINGRQATPGACISSGDRVCIDGRMLGKEIFLAPATRCLLYNKPAGQLCTRADPEGRPTVFDRLPPLKGGRRISVGRLDINSSGLLLLTTHGRLAHRLMHPSFSVDREYLVRFQGDLDESRRQRLCAGVMLEDGTAHFKKMQLMNGRGINYWYRVVVGEGRNRLVRRLMESQGLRVNRLIRKRYGPLSLPRSLVAGQWQELDNHQRARLFRYVGLPVSD